MSWRSVLLMEETGEHEKTTDMSHFTDKLYHIMLYQVHLTCTGFKLTTLVVIGTDCIGSCKSNYHMIRTMTAPVQRLNQVNKLDKIYKIREGKLTKQVVKIDNLTLLFDMSL